MRRTTVARPSRSKNFALTGICFLFAISILSWTYCGHLPFSTGPQHGDEPGASNRTLGFGAIYVLTEDPDTWRTQGLLRAAEHIGGLDLTIPIQKRPTDEAIKTFLKGDKLNQKNKSQTSIRSVLNHISLLETFLQSEHETALFLEDDIDFDIHLKPQLKLLSDAILHGMQASESNGKQWFAGTPDSPIQASTLNPYRHHTWDVLWLGHCGVKITKNTHNISYSDPYALPWTLLSCGKEDCYADLRRDAAPQQVSHFVAPKCSYAFAITRQHASVLAAKVREEREQDLGEALFKYCRDGWQHCVASMPELFHHHHVLGQEESDGKEGERISGEGGEQPGVATLFPSKQDLEWWRGRHKYTYNLQWSARCNAEKVGEILESAEGKRWQCLPGRWDEAW